MTLQEMLDANMDTLRQRFAELNSKVILKEASADEEREAALVWNELKLREASELTKNLRRPHKELNP